MRGASKVPGRDRLVLRGFAVGAIVLVATLALVGRLDGAPAAPTPAARPASTTAPGPVRFQHVIVVIQENRTPDNLFQGLCTSPFGSAASCSATPKAHQYNISTGPWWNKTVWPWQAIQPAPIELGTSWDPRHTHADFVAMCLTDPGGPPPPRSTPLIPRPGGPVRPCSNGGALRDGCNSGPCPVGASFSYVDNTDRELDPYLTLATRYGFANAMFQTNQGPSFPAHQFLYGGTSAPSAQDDAEGVFAAENPSGSVRGNPSSIGCANPHSQVTLIVQDTPDPTPVPACFEHPVLSDRFGPASWKYYATGSSSYPFWIAPNAIAHVCNAGGGRCNFPSNVDLAPADVLNDICHGQLPAVSWVTPTGYASDHAGSPDNVDGPSWVAAIVNAIGQGLTRDGNGRPCNSPGRSTYWDNTAIFITWDDWGGWYDHVPPPLLPAPEGYYEYGFRVPLLVVSAYTSAGTISNRTSDFGSILRFTERNFDVTGLGFADARSARKGFSDLTEYFNLATPRPFRAITAARDARFFLTDNRPPTAPDSD